ncbi:hypothetical protein FOL47_002337 [Perkinsus chesapeaki]|uniref:Uncharacterized protein n=1 Tax=Perkinsus chesapeaki TaxID=330153 RepID=A0A7J6MDZ4_PERCH|nr:hypothetical protein FOL47_002337 [Perkinsus chesapeaki]
MLLSSLRTEAWPSSSSSSPTARSKRRSVFDSCGARSWALGLFWFAAISSTVLAAFILVYFAPLSSSGRPAGLFFRRSPKPIPPPHPYGIQRQTLNDGHYLAAGDLTNISHGRPEYVDFITTAMEETKKDTKLWTGVQCTGHQLNHSCIFDNLYYTPKDEKFHVILPSFAQIRRANYYGRPVDVSSDPSSLLMSRDHLTPDAVEMVLANCSDFFMGDVPFIPTGGNFTPIIHIFNSSSEALSWLSASSPHTGLPTIIDGLTVYGFSLYMHNVGHLLYDGIYPLFISMIRFGYGEARVNAAFRIVYNEMHQPGQKVPADTVVPKFFGGTYYRLNDFSEDLYRFQRVIVGSRRMAHRSLNLQGTMPGSYSFENSLYYFTQRLKAAYGLVPWTDFMSANAEIKTDRAAGGCKGVFTDNKRFTEHERAMFRSILAKLKKSGLCDIIFLQWEEHSFREQLEIFSESDVYISGVGTGITRAHMIKPGGVVVNLGEFETIGYPPRVQASYRDVQFSTGAPYLGVLFYPARLWNIYGEFQPEAVEDIIEQAVRKVKEGFVLPRPLEDGLSHVGKTFSQYCEQSPEDCDELNSELNPFDDANNDYWCALCSWPEYIGLDSMWHEGQSCEWYGAARQCKFNYRLFEECQSPDHIAFDKECHEANRPAMRHQRQTLLQGQATELGVGVSELSPSQATEALLAGRPPDCPVRYEPGLTCSCQPLVWL